MRLGALMSGGVDSTVAALLMKEAGHDITAFYIKIWLEDDCSFLGSCPWEEDLGFVRDVCAQWRIPLEVISLQKEYWNDVVAYTIAQVRAGKTPNPDILCNARIKFGAFYDQVGHAFDGIITGHYAQIVHCAERAYMCQSCDVIKDQTYFLAQVAPERLARMHCPVGMFTKEQVRAFARIYNTPNKDRKDSQGICFLGKIKYRDFLAHHVGMQKGDLIEWETGAHMGSHDGFWFYTPGQRQGIGLSGGPWYVVSKDCHKNIVYVSKQYDVLAQDRCQVVLEDLFWLVPEEHVARVLAGDFGIKLRHGPHMHQACLFSARPECSQAGWCAVAHNLKEREKAITDAQLVIKLREPDQGIAEGQYGVIYHEGICIGGGIIGACV